MADAEPFGYLSFPSLPHQFANAALGAIHDDINLAVVFLENLALLVLVPRRIALLLRHFVMWKNVVIHL